MLSFNHWYVIIGVLLILMVVIRPRFDPLPLTITMFYLGLGWIFGFLGWIQLDPLEHRALLERLSEVAVLISLFGAGLKLRLPLNSRRWRLPLGLASISMIATVAMIAMLGVYWFHLPVGAAIVLGAVLAPTDPVLASDVQVTDPRDVDRVRFTLTGEAGINDGTAFPLVMLGLGLLGQHELGLWAWRWWTVDVLWAIVAGVGSGTLLGLAVGRMVIYLRQSRKEAMGLDDFLALGLIASAYGTALLLHAYGFLAVFAAGLALRRIEREHTGEEPPLDVKAVAGESAELASDPAHAPAYMAEAVLHMNEQSERIAELGLVILVGAMLSLMAPRWESIGAAFVLFMVIRPITVAPLLIAGGIDRVQTALISWFGVRGIGSIYYLFYALERGISDDLAKILVDTVLWTIALSIVLHGITVTPFMRFYEGRHGQRPRPDVPARNSAELSTARH